MHDGSGALADGDWVEPIAKKRSDLPVRVASAVVMVTVAGAAFWLGGWALIGFIVAIGLGIYAEWAALVFAFEARFAARAIWLAAGLVYIGLACCAALQLLDPSPRGLLLVVGSVIAVDVGAYFSGRTFGGPKIAPSISPSKTWSGLGGAILAASAVYMMYVWTIYRHELEITRYIIAHYGAEVGNKTSPQLHWLLAIVLGTATAIIAQSGDFFESWMKRRAGVKDSGRLIPGHGGFFDRADGLMAVLFANGVVALIWFMRP